MAGAEIFSVAAPCFGIASTCVPPLVAAVARQMMRLVQPGGQEAGPETSGTYPVSFRLRFGRIDETRCRPHAPM